VEIMVASFVLSLLLMVAVQLLIPALRAWTDGQQRSEISQSLLVTTNWIGDDVLRSAPDSLRVTDEGVLVMRCSEGPKDDHKNEFNQLVAYWETGGELFRGEHTLGSEGSGPPEITLAELGSLQTVRRVAFDLTSFEAEVVQPWRVELNLKIAKGERNGELQTSFASMYAPFDPNIAEEN
jgi:hypothetical protein